MSSILMGWANVWVLDRSGLNLGHVLAYVGTGGLVCDILS